MAAANVGIALLPGAVGVLGDEPNQLSKQRPDDPDTVERFELYVGGFDKPRYITFTEDLCAHSRSRIVGCRRCLDLCPTGAITPPAVMSVTSRLIILPLLVSASTLIVSAARPSAFCPAICSTCGSEAQRAVQPDLLLRLEQPAVAALRDEQLDFLRRVHVPVAGG